jgi:hypothetical protein
MDEERMKSLLQSVISASEVPLDIIQYLARTLLRLMLQEGHTPAESTSFTKQLLISIKQRWEPSVNAVAEELQAAVNSNDENDDDDGFTDSDVKEVIASLSMVCAFVTAMTVR